LKPDPQISESAATNDFKVVRTGAELNKHCGTLAHIYMELLAKSEVSNWHQQKLAQCQPAMQKWLMQQGHSATNSAQGAAQVSAALQTTLSSHFGQWVLQNHQEAVSELSLMQSQEDGVKNHIIDRTFITNGTRWIVDYKLTTLNENDDLANDNLAKVAEQHRPQLERYASLFASAGLPIKMAVLFLNLGELVEL